MKDFFKNVAATIVGLFAFGLIMTILGFICIIGMIASSNSKPTLKNSSDGQSELTCYLPKNPSGRAVVDCPGGGYSHLAMDHEGHQWAEYFNKQGIAFFVLKYRMPYGNRNIPLSDAYQAIRTVRDSSAVWKINKEEVGIMGFSAGGHLASSVSTHAETAVRPNFSILFYPVISMDERISHKGSCVNFLGGELFQKHHPGVVHGQRIGNIADPLRRVFQIVHFPQQTRAAILGIITPGSIHGDQFDLFFMVIGKLRQLFQIAVEIGIGLQRGVV